MKKRFNILHTEWSEGFGGQEMRILLEIRQHLKSGHTVFLVAPPQSPLIKKAKDQGAAVIPLKIRHTFDLSAFARLIKILKEKEIDVLHTHSSVDSWVASLAGKWAGVAVLVRTRHISVPARSHRLNIIYSLPDAVITTGEQIRQTLLEGYHLPLDRVFSIPTGVDRDRFFPRSPDFKLKRELGLPEEASVITLVAILRTQKRHELLIEAAPAILQKYPRTRFLFVGEGSGRKRIMEALNRTRMEPFFILTGHREDIPDILSFTDVGIISSRAEGVPQFLLQGMAMEKPMVATRVGGIPDIIEDGTNGLLIPPEDSRALSAAVLRLLDDPDTGRRLGQQALALIDRKYTADHMAEAVAKIYWNVYNRKNEQKR